MSKNLNSSVWGEIKPDVWSMGSPKRPFNLYSKLDWINENIFKKMWLFLLIMTIYHLAVIVYVTFGIETYPYVKLLTMLDFNVENMASANATVKPLIQVIVFSLITVILDVAIFVLMVLSFKETFQRIHFKWWWLGIFEGLVLIFSASSMFVRIVLWWLSVNSIPIFVPYLIMKKVPLFNYIFIFGAIVNLIVFILFPLHPIDNLIALLTASVK